MGLDKEDIKALIAILQKGLENDEEVSTSTEEPAVSKPKAKNSKKNTSHIKTRGRSKVTSQKYQNKFESMQEFALHKEDATIDQQLSKHPPVARIRENVKPVKVSCRICGKTETVNPSLVFEGASRYKCNRCSTQSG